MTEAAAEDKSLSKESLVLYVSIFVMGACGLAYEYTFSKLSSDLLGNSFRQWAIIIGVMMFFMGVGSDIQKKIRDKDLMNTFLLGEVALAVLGAFGPVIMLFAYGQFYSHYALVQYFFVGAIGLLIGFEIPLLTRINSQYNGQLRLNLGSMLRMDYMGSLIGALAWVFVLPYYFTVIEMAFVLGLFTMAAAVCGLVYFRKRVPGFTKVCYVMAVAVALIVAGLFQARDWEVAGQQYLYQDKIVLSESSPYQHIVVTESRSDTVRMYINGHLQFSSMDEHIYHENLVHPAMQIAPRRDRVLVLGGGDGLAVREILKYDDVKEVTLCDLDPLVTKLARESDFFTRLNGHSLNEGRLHIVDNNALVPSGEFDLYVDDQKSGFPIKRKKVDTLKILNVDALKFLEQVPGVYDVIIVDFPDPNAPEVSKLYSSMFYHHLKKRLAPRGVFVQQSTSPFWAKEAFLNIGRTIKSSGFVALPFHDNVPSFGVWGFWLAGRDDYYEEMDLRGAIESITTLKAQPRYLTPELVKANFVFGRNELKSPNNDINTILSSRLHEYYLQGWQKTL